MAKGRLYYRGGITLEGTVRKVTFAAAAC